MCEYRREIFINLFLENKVRKYKCQNITGKHHRNLGLLEILKYCPTCRHPRASPSDKKLVPVFSILTVNIARQQALAAQLYRNVNTAVPAIREGLEATICLAGWLAH